jgi:hypothetical protein
MLPLGALMFIEKMTGHNPFGFLGGVNEYSLVREGRIRAAGPFAHPLLAGTAGGTGVGMALYIYKHHKAAGLAGILGSLAVVFAVTSSGPVLMVLAIIFALLLWPLREYMSAIRLSFVGLILLLSAVMHDPVYFLVARIDISGGSQGYYRAQLIRSTIEHFDEWWSIGTDYTRHWMSSGIYANSKHTDITNHFIAMGVMGGLLLQILWVMVLAAGFRMVGRTMRHSAVQAQKPLVLAWLLGSILFGHVVNSLSVSLFDQSIVFLYMTLAAICALPTEVAVAHQANDGHRDTTPPKERPRVRQSQQVLKPTTNRVGGGLRHEHNFDYHRQLEYPSLS